MLILSTIALFIGFILDILFGDPHRVPHIVVGMGRLIAALEKKRRPRGIRNPEKERLAGVFLVSMVLLSCITLSTALLLLAYRTSLWLGLALEALLCYQFLASKSLYDESMKVYYSLAEHDLNQARHDVSMIVGRDTDQLDETGIIKATVETVAENTSDGVIAPLFYIMLGGAVFGCLYKAVNTLDSMVGYKNETYLYFGWASAKLDDVMNFLPARLAAKLMIVAAFFLGMDAKNARYIYRRDKMNHASPNSAHTEAVCAGALKVQLAGNAFYFGKLLEKPFIGDDLRPIEIEDIRRANWLMLISALLMLLLVLTVRAVVIGVVIFGAL